MKVKIADDFALALGDGLWACDGVALDASDVALDSSGRLVANTARKAAQVHAMATYKQIVQTLPSRLTYLLPFSIDYAPRPDASQVLNPQTIECCAEVWDGATKTKTTVGIQWALNPWTQPVINVWRGVDWETVYPIVIVPGDRYRFAVRLHYGAPQSSRVALERWDGSKWLGVQTWQSYGTQTHADWGPELAWWVTAECISCSPSCSPPLGFTHHVDFGPEADLEIVS